MMISIIRNGIKSTASKIFLWILFSSFIFGYGFSRIFKKSTKGYGGSVATVNGEEISRSIFLEKKEKESRKLEMLRMQYGQYADMLFSMMGMSLDPKKAAIDALVFQELVDQYCNNNDIEVGFDYVESKIMDPNLVADEMENSFVQGLFDASGRLDHKLLNEILKKDRAFANRLQKRCKRDFAISLPSVATYVPQFIIDSNLKSSHLLKKFSFVTFELENFVKKAKETPATPEQLKKFFDDQTKKGGYWIPEKRGGIKWTFKSSTYGFELTQDEIKDYYDKNKQAKFVNAPVEVQVREILFDNTKDNGLSALQEMADKVYEKVIAKPELFSECIKSDSQNKDSIAKDGLTEFFSRGKKDKEYEKAALRLKNDGDISQVIKMENGFAILQRVSRKDPTYKTLESVLPEIKTLLTEQKFKKEFAKDAKELVKNKSLTHEQLMEFVKKHNGIQENVIPEIKSDKPMYQKLYGFKKSGDKGFLIEDGNGVIVQLTSLIEKLLPPVEMMQPMIASDFYKMNAQKLMIKEIENCKKSIFENGSKIISTFKNATVLSSSFISASDNVEIEKITKLGVPKQFLNLEKVGSVMSLNSGEKSFIFILEEAKEDGKTIEQEKINQEIENSYKKYQNLSKSAFIASLFRNATIKINESFLNGRDN